jgi:hypothetical protein
VTDAEWLPGAGEGGRPDPGFDLWSLAVVLFETISGEHPLKRSTAAGTLAAIRAGWTEEQQSLLPLHPHLVDLFSCSLDRERPKRPATASNLAHLIRVAREDPAIVA